MEILNIKYNKEVNYIKLFLNKSKEAFKITVFSILMGLHPNIAISGEIDNVSKIENQQEENNYLAIILFISLIISIFYNAKQKLDLDKKNEFLNDFNEKLTKFISGDYSIVFSSLSSYFKDDKLIELFTELDNLKITLLNTAKIGDISYILNTLIQDNQNLVNYQGQKLNQDKILQLVLSLSTMEKDNGLRNLESLQSSGITLVTSLHAAIEILDLQINELKENGGSLDDILLQIKSLADLIFEFTSLVEEANLKINGLSEFSNNIKNIAKEIKLLSINASIEASHFGEKGSGFKVVGERIKELSDNTSILALGIEKGLSQFKEWFNNDFLKKFLLIKEKTEEVTSGISFIRNSFDSTINSMLNTNKQLDYVRSLFFISLVKLDHVIFKQIAYKFVSNNGELTNTEIDTIRKTHKQCRLGCWYEKHGGTDCESGGVYNGKGYEEHGNSSDFTKLNLPHKMFHKTIGDILILIESLDGKITEKDYEKLKDMFLQAETYSNEIFSILDNIVSEGTGEIELF
nr:methyl-accepting chemotaxis protein [Candidatus Gracilibacteria bacterium]